MTHPRHVDDERAAAALADLLNRGERRRPIVVVTIPAGRTEPWIDVDEVAREVSDLADVYLIPTGGVTWEFSRRMAEGTQVYGGAGRVYPLGHEWARDLTASPLRFAFNADDGKRATEKIISDALRMAAASGVVQTRPASELRHLTGTVSMVIAGRALVDVGNLLPATIPEELTVEGVPIGRIVASGQQIDGWYEVASNRINVTDNLRGAPEALASYAVGDVVLTKVVTVRNGKAELVLYPKTTTPAVVVAVLRADDTANPADDLRTLMTVGEVIPVRIVSTGPQWAVVLNDVDDDEPITAAPSLLPGGPPWLVEESSESPAARDEPAPSAALPMPVAVPTPVSDASPVHAEAAAAPSAPAPVRPSPAMFDKFRGGPPRPVPGPPRSASSPASAPAAATSPALPTQGLLLKIDALAARVAALTRAQAGLEAQLRAGDDASRQLRFLLGEEERRANRAEHELKSTKSRLRKAGNKASTPASDGRPVFADAEQGFRYLVLTRWATRTPANEQASRPLPEFRLGPTFLDSLGRLEGIKVEKVADVVVEIVTGRASQLSSRELHRLRTGMGGDDPVRTRPDGATAWRASLQVNTPSARRLHYWTLPTGEIELARVTTHDDFDA